jgi:hypothetical protein
MSNLYTVSIFLVLKVRNNVTALIIKDKAQIPIIKMFITILLFNNNADIHVHHQHRSHHIDNRPCHDFS